MLVLLDLGGVFEYPEGSAGELPWATHAWRLLDRMEFGRALPLFLTVWDRMGEHNKHNQTNEASNN
jgi:hypothetical protein